MEDKDEREGDIARSPLTVLHGALASSCGLVKKKQEDVPPDAFLEQAPTLRVRPLSRCAHYFPWDIHSDSYFPFCSSG